MANGDSHFKFICKGQKSKDACRGKFLKVGEIFECLNADLEESSEEGEVEAISEERSVVKGS